MSFDGTTRDILIFLVTAGIVVPLFSRIRLGIVLGFLIAGVLLGPRGVGALAQDYPWLRYIAFDTDNRVAPFADLGVLFLMFTVGLDLSFNRLWSMRRIVLGAGIAQVVVSTAVIAVALHWFNVDIIPAVILGLGFAFSSTAITLQLLTLSKRLGSDVGRTSFGILLMQDLMVVPGVILITVVSGDSGVSVPEAVLRGVGLAIGAVVIIVLAGRFILRPLFNLAAATRSREIIMAIALLIAIGSALATEAAGLSAALGAFLAGLLLASSEYRHQVEVDIEPFKGLLLGVFFMTVGMSVDLSLVWRELPAIAVAVLALLVTKALIAYGVSRAIGTRHPTALETALLLAGAGEFAFVLFTLANKQNLLVAADLHFATTIVALSMLLTPLLAAAGHRWSAASAKKNRAIIDGRIAEAGPLEGHLIVGGFGRVGETIARLLEAMSTPYIAVDIDASRVASARAAGRPVYFGDIGRKELIDRLGGDKAVGFVITSDLPAETNKTVVMIRAGWPEAKIFARAKDPAHAHKLIGLGATDVVPEAAEGSLQLAAHVLTGIGVPDHQALEMIDHERAELLHDIGPEQA